MNLSIDRIVKDLRDKVDSYELPDGIQIIPDYPSIKSSREELYNSYSGAVVAYNNLCKILSEMQYTQVTIDKMLRNIATSSEVFSRQKFLNSELSSIKSDLRIIIESYSTLKSSMESSIRFFQSIQYILSSPRLDT